MTFVHNAAALFVAAASAAVALLIHITYHVPYDEKEVQ